MTRFPARASRRGNEVTGGDITASPSLARRRPDALAAAAASIVIVLIASVLAVVLGNGDDEAWIVRSTVALDFMDGPGGAAEALIGGTYALSPAESFTRQNRTMSVVAGTRSKPSIALLPNVSQRDVAISAAVAFVGSRSSDVSASVIARRGTNGGYRAIVTVDPLGNADLRISRTGVDLAELTWAELPFKITPTDRVVVELRAVGEDAVALRARAWVDSAAATMTELSAIDDSESRHTSGGTVGFSAVSPDGSAPATIRVDDLRAFALEAVEIEPGSAYDIPARGTPTDDGNEGTPTRENAGSLPIGAAAYPVPSGAIVVAPRGREGATGNLKDPVLTIREAVDRASPGATIVLRAGVYHEAISLPENSHLTVQSAPGEEAWLDGSSVVNDWERRGDVWTASGWTTTFDSSPTYTAGVPDGTEPGWRFVNEENPLAAHPDQMWIDGAPQRQVESLGDVVAGTFFVDYAAQTLSIGTDPTSRTVRSSDLGIAVSMKTTDAIFRGIGVRRFSPSVPQLGAVRSEAASTRIENVTILDSATTGLFIRDPHTRIRHVTVARSGMLGVAVSYADDLALDSVVSIENNTEGFNTSPVSGGAKITRSRSVRVFDSVFDSNAGHGLWFDESTYDGVAVGNDVSFNTGHGLIMEISAKFLVVNNVISGNSQNGIKLNDSSDVEIWNNTLVGNGRTINIVQDGRRASNESTPGHDPRQAFPDPTMTWIIGAITVRNNIMAESTGKCLLCIEDYSKEYTAEELGVSANGNVYQRNDVSAPTWLAVWSKGEELNPAVYTSIAAFTAATGQERSGRELSGVSAVTPSGAITEALASEAGAIARPLPDNIAAVARAQAGQATLGAWRAPAVRP